MPSTGQAEEVRANTGFQNILVVSRGWPVWIRPALWALGLPVFSCPQVASYSNTQPLKQRTFITTSFLWGGDGEWLGWGLLAQSQTAQPRCQLALSSEASWGRVLLARGALTRLARQCQLSAEGLAPARVHLSQAA